jgi:hypothetical protein
MAVSMKMAVFWVVVLCSLVEVYLCFRGTCCLHYQALCTSEMSVNFYQTTWHYNPEHSHLQEANSSCSLNRSYESWFSSHLKTLKTPPDLAKHDYHLWVSLTPSPPLITKTAKNGLLMLGLVQLRNNKLVLILILLVLKYSNTKILDDYRIATKNTKQCCFILWVIIPGPLVP